MAYCKTSSIRRFAHTQNQARCFYRWIHHKKITRQDLIRTSIENTSTLVEGRHVLAIQDTTQIHDQVHADRATGLGTVGNGSDAGIFLYPLFIVDAETRQGLGFGHIHIWNRFKQKDPNYPKLPIEEKESYRWIETASAGKKNLAKARKYHFLDH